MLPTGIAIALPDGYAAFVHPRSGLAARTGMSLVNAPGTVDSGYRGEITVNVINHDRVAPIVLRRGDRIAQLVIQRVEVGEFVEVDVLPASQRGTGGHGSTGGAARSERSSPRSTPRRPGRPGTTMSHRRRPVPTTCVTHLTTSSRGSISVGCGFPYALVWRCAW